MENEIKLLKAELNNKMPNSVEILTELPSKERTKPFLFSVREGDTGLLNYSCGIYIPNGGDAAILAYDYLNTLNVIYRNSGKWGGVRKI